MYSRCEFELACRLGYEVVDTTIEGHDDTGRGIFCGQQHDTGVAVVIFVPAAYQVGHLKAIHAGHPEISKQEKVRIDMLERFGYFSTFLPESLSNSLG